MNPSTKGSMMIVVPGVERGVIVFPATLDSAVVTVGDVILAVHRVIRGWVVEHHDGFGVECGVEGRRKDPSRGQGEITGKGFFTSSKALKVFSNYLDVQSQIRREKKIKSHQWGPLTRKSELSMDRSH